MTELKKIVKQVHDAYDRYIRAVDQHHQAKEAVLDRKLMNKAHEMSFVLEGIPGKNQGERDAWLANEMSDAYQLQSALEAKERFAAHVVTITKLEVDRIQWKVRALELIAKAEDSEQTWEEVAAEVIDQEQEVIQ